MVIDLWSPVGMSEINRMFRLIFQSYLSQSPFLQGECATLLNAANYIPSTVRTILQFRSGAIDSLHDPSFLKLRLAGTLNLKQSY